MVITYRVNSRLEAQTSKERSADQLEEVIHSSVVIGKEQEVNLVLIEHF